MFGTQIDDSVTVTTPSEADLAVTKVKIHRFQIDPIGLPVVYRICLESSHWIISLITLIPNMKVQVKTF